MTQTGKVTTSQMSEMMHVDEGMVIHFPFREDLRWIINDLILRGHSRKSVIQRLSELMKRVSDNETLGEGDKELYTKGITEVISQVELL